MAVGDVFRRLSSSPTLLAITSICTIVALPLSIYLFFAGQRNRELAYTVAPSRTVVVDPTFSSSLGVTVNGSPVRSPVTGVSFELFNQGEESIKPENVLERVEIVSDPRARIFEARVVGMSRRVVGLKVDSSQFNDGTVPVSWKILEAGDRATLQIIYAGPSSIDFRLRGLIEGQRRITAAAPRSSITRKVLSFVAGILTGAVLPTFVALVASFFLRRRAGEPAADGLEYAQIIFVPRAGSMFRKLKVSHRLIYAVVLLLTSSTLLSIFFFFQFLRSVGLVAP